MERKIGQIVTKDTYHYRLRLGSTRSVGYRPKSWWMRHQTAIYVVAGLIGGAAVIFVNRHRHYDLKTVSISQKKRVSHRTAKRDTVIAVSAEETREVSP